jgi:hypothetical protein
MSKNKQYEFDFSPVIIDAAWRKADRLKHKGKSPPFMMKTAERFKQAAKDNGCTRAELESWLHGSQVRSQQKWNEQNRK